MPNAPQKTNGSHSRQRSSANSKSKFCSRSSVAKSPPRERGSSPSRTASHSRQAGDQDSNAEVHGSRSNWRRHEAAPGRSRRALRAMLNARALLGPKFHAGPARRSVRTNGAARLLRACVCVCVCVCACVRVRVCAFSLTVPDMAWHGMVTDVRCVCCQWHY